MNTCRTILNVNLLGVARTTKSSANTPNDREKSPRSPARKTASAQAMAVRMMVAVVSLLDWAVSICEEGGNEGEDMG